MVALVGASVLAGVLVVDFMAVTQVGDGADTTQVGVTQVGDIQVMDTTVVDMHHITQLEEEATILEGTPVLKQEDVARITVAQIQVEDEVLMLVQMDQGIRLVEIVAQDEVLLEHKTERHQNTILLEEAVA